MKKLFKFILKLVLLAIISLILYISYLYIQNPLVISRLGGVIIGKSPGIPETIESGIGIPLKNFSERKSINQNSIDQAIKFS